MAEEGLFVIGAVDGFIVLHFQQMWSYSPRLKVLPGSGGRKTKWSSAWQTSPFPVSFLRLTSCMMHACMSYPETQSSPRDGPREQRIPEKRVPLLLWGKSTESTHDLCVFPWRCCTSESLFVGSLTASRHQSLVAKSDARVFAPLNSWAASANSAVSFSAYIRRMNNTATFSPEQQATRSPWRCRPFLLCGCRRCAVRAICRSELEWTLPTLWPETLSLWSIFAGASRQKLNQIQELQVFHARTCHHLANTKTNSSQFLPRKDFKLLFLWQIVGTSCCHISGTFQEQFHQFVSRTLNLSLAQCWVGNWVPSGQISSPNLHCSLFHCTCFIPLQMVTGFSDNALRKVFGWWPRLQENWTWNMHKVWTILILLRLMIQQKQINLIVGVRR